MIIGLIMFVICATILAATDQKAYQARMRKKSFRHEATGSCRVCDPSEPATGPVTLWPLFSFLNLAWVAFVVYGVKYRAKVSAILVPAYGGASLALWLTAVSLPDDAQAARMALAWAWVAVWIIGIVHSCSIAGHETRRRKQSSLPIVGQ